MRRHRLWSQAMVGGAAAGVLLEILALRLNPEIPIIPSVVFLGWLLWSSWGAVAIGLPLAGCLGLVRLLRPNPSPVRWMVPEIVAASYLVAAALARANADLYAAFLTGSGHRTLRQDAVGWIVGFLLAVAAGIWLRRPRWRRWRIPVIALLLVLPLVRLLWQPAPVRRIDEVVAEPLGRPARPLLVIGLEGLDSRVLLTHANGDQYPTLQRFSSAGSWGMLKPYRPFLRRSLWTTTATGAYPRRHGVKARYTWRLFGGITLRLLPWSPMGFEWLLPWHLVSREDAPPSALPPLWERLGVSGVPSAAIGWPGLWAREPLSPRLDPSGGLALLEPDLRASLEYALAPFADERAAVLEAIGTDLARCRAARQELTRGTVNLWLHLQSLAAVRTTLEPLRSRHVREREVLERVLEFLDQQIGSLVGALDPRALVVLVSPYGMEPPDAKERVLRLLGDGGSWRTSPRSCPDGVLALLGNGVVGGQRLKRAALTDVAPTVCYLLGLPVAQYMEGRVLLAAVSADFVAAHPLRVVE